MVNVMVICFSCVMILYLIWISYLILGTKQRMKPPEKQADATMAIIIPTRNHSDTLNILLSNLQSQITSFNNVQIIVVDDHSEKIPSFETHSEKIKVIRNEGIGKKNALKTGIQHCQAEWIITLDDDIILPPQWMKILQAECQPMNDVLILPIAITPPKGFLHFFQWLEFSILQQITHGSANRNTPLLCNGAHLAFKRCFWLTYHETNSSVQISSGDDQFLLESARLQKRKIKFVNQSELVVQTAPCNSWGALFEQRRRWSSKSTKYQLMDMKMLGWITLTSNIGFIYLFSFWTVFPQHLEVIFILILYGCVEFLWTEKKAKEQPLSTLLFLLFYPFYVIATMFSFVIFRTHWKGRGITH
jgi:cellulose synthase/poly-beta-1,6-N-acetylglucosamine synthase-like glycosyltransferase